MSPLPFPSCFRHTELSCLKLTTRAATRFMAGSLDNRIEYTQHNDSIGSLPSLVSALWVNYADSTPRPCSKSTYSPLLPKREPLHRAYAKAPVWTPVAVSEDSVWHLLNVSLVCAHDLGSRRLTVKSHSPVRSGRLSDRPSTGGNVPSTPCRMSPPLVAFSKPSRIGRHVSPAFSAASARKRPSWSLSRPLLSPSSCAAIQLAKRWPLALVSPDRIVRRCHVFASSVTERRSRRNGVGPSPWSSWSWAMSSAEMTKAAWMATVRKNPEPLKTKRGNRSTSSAVVEVPGTSVELMNGESQVAHHILIAVIDDDLPGKGVRGLMKRDPEERHM